MIEEGYRFRIERGQRGLKKLDDKDHMQELMEDFVEIVKSFASRIYGHRSHRYDKVVKCVEDVEKDG